MIVMPSIFVYLTRGFSRDRGTTAEAATLRRTLSSKKENAEGSGELRFHLSFSLFSCHDTRKYENGNDGLAVFGGALGVGG